MKNKIVLQNGCLLSWNPKNGGVNPSHKSQDMLAQMAEEALENLRSGQS